MKQNIKNYAIIIISLLGFTLVSSFILALTEKNNVMNYNTSIVVSNALSYIYIAIFSFILGLKSKQHGLLHGIVFSLILILSTLIIGNDISDITTIIKTVTKSIIAIFFTILGVNKKNPN